MTKEQFETMRNAYEIVTRFRETNKLWKDLECEEQENATWHEYVGAKTMFEKLFGISYYEARDIFSEHFMEVPF